ncbi:MAG: thiosulfate oxidation carrier protein SoxY [Gammaproteobacteria bacterium]|nr:thiosulfate oxidation carrier protein SoxY [Gammaproteobacteria bacterium]
MSMKRRTFLKGTVAAVGVAAAAGLLSPRAVLAAWPKAAFDAKSMADAEAAAGLGGAAHSDAIEIKAPDIAENGAVVPITVTSGIDGTTSISILASENGTPMAAQFELGEGAQGMVSVRIKMGKTSDVYGMVKAGGKVYANKKQVKVTIGGCGG